MKTIEQYLIFFLLIHWLADFALQTHKQAIGKGEGKNFFNRELLKHVSVYSLIWLLISNIIEYNWIKALEFSIITFICHYITDYITSRISKKFFNDNDYHNGFEVVGFDQILHYLQLYYTFKFIYYEQII